MTTADKVLTIHADGGCVPNPGPASIGAVVKNKRGEVKAQISQYIGRATNNKAEYRAAIAGLEKALELGAEKVDVYLDSELVLRQLMGAYKVKKRDLVPLYERAKELLGRFESYTLQHVSSWENQEAHQLAHQALHKGRM